MNQYFNKNRISGEVYLEHLNIQAVEGLEHYLRAITSTCLDFSQLLKSLGVGLGEKFQEC